jgi:hypothetical protein
MPDLGLRRATTEQRKLALSLATNFATRVPGAVGVLWFLPLLRYGLGTDHYSALLAALALGNSASALRAGFVVIGRRTIGEAYSRRDRAGEADAFVSLVLAGIGALAVGLAITLFYCWRLDADISILVVSAMPVIAAFLNTFDNVRSAYNEHYVTALLQTVLQVGLYTIGLAVPVFRESVVLACLILQGSYMAASLLTCMLLIRGRPYLLAGRPAAAWTIVRDGMIISIADGFMLASLSLAVVWLQATADDQTSAWFASVVRLFETFLVPVVLTLTPLSSYIRLRWNEHSSARQRRLTVVTLVFGVGYGVAVAIGLFAATRFYVDRLLHLSQPGGLIYVLPCFVLFAAVVAYRTYSLVAYVVSNQSRHLSYWSALAVFAGLIAGVAVQRLTVPLGVIAVYAVTAGAATLAVLVWNAARSAFPGVYVGRLS